MRAVIGVPTYNGASHVADTLATLLGQEGAHVAVVVVDDASGDDTVAIAQRLADTDRRLTVIRNPVRLGMRDNWVRAFNEATASHPEAEFFAWGSDHDRWDPRWLASMIAALDANPGAVVAYPLAQRVTPGGEEIQAPVRFETAGLVDRRARLHAAFRGMVAGDMIYGLFRIAPLREAGVFPAALMPDRLLLARLAALGEFVQVDEVLWHRRMTAPSTPTQQRRTLFTSRPPSLTRLPWWLGHTLTLARSLGVRVALDYFRASWWIATRTRLARLRARRRGADAAR